jgi:hypothetical protein
MFSGRRRRASLSVSRQPKKLKLRVPHVITVTGEAFYDIAHALRIIQTGTLAVKIMPRRKDTR